MANNALVTNRDGVAYVAFQGKDGPQLIERIPNPVVPRRSADIIRLPTRVRYQDRT